MSNINLRTPFTEYFNEKKSALESAGHSQEDLYSAIEEVTGFDRFQIDGHLSGGSTIGDVFLAAPKAPDTENVDGSVSAAPVDDFADDPRAAGVRRVDAAVQKLIDG